MVHGDTYRLQPGSRVRDGTTAPDDKNTLRAIKIGCGSKLKHSRKLLCTSFLSVASCFLNAVCVITVIARRETFKFHNVALSSKKLIFLSLWIL